MAPSNSRIRCCTALCNSSVLFIINKLIYYLSLKYFNKINDDFYHFPSHNTKITNNRDNNSGKTGRTKGTKDRTKQKQKG